MKFSIITCTFNNTNFLKKNINSIKFQTHRNYEHIFIDGFSNDGTVEIIKEYQKEYPDKVFLYQTNPKGISNAMNEGIKKSTGDYLIHLHSDDSLCSENVLEDVGIFLSKNNPDWTYGKINTINDRGNSLGIFPTKKIFQHTNHNFFKKYLLKFYNYIPHQSIFIKKSVFNTYGYFDESLTSAMDLDMWLRIKNKTNLIFFDKLISNYMIRAGAQSSSKIKRKENLKNSNIVQKRYLNFAEYLISKIINILLDLKNKNYK